ncbi:MAG: TolC family protein [Chitinophagaceae bacterium]|nr:TolC family protein [Chitinophagaceae bacterium]
MNLYILNNKFIIMMITIIMMGSCAVPKITNQFKEIELPASFADKNDTVSLAQLDLKTFFSDTALYGLIEIAIENNPDIQKALRRIMMAQAQLQMAHNARLPVIDAVATGGFNKFGKYTIDGVGNFDTNLSPNINKDQRIPILTPDLFLGFRSNWEVDIWGKLNDKKKAALSRSYAAEKERQWLTTQLAAQVASMYYELLALDSELAILYKNLRLQEDALEVVKIQKSGGRATELAVQQFESQLYTTRSYIVSLKQGVIKTENELNLLLGRLPQPIKRSNNIFTGSVLPEIKTGIPSHLLVRRPDIQASQMKLIAAGFDVNAAKKSFLPSLNITPYTALHSFNASMIFTPASIAYGVIGGVSGPVWNRGRLKGMLKEAVASEGEAWYDYQQSVFTAFQEVVTCMNAITNNTNLFELKKKQVSVLESAVSTARELYVTGYASYLEVITAQKGALETQLESVSTYKNVLLSQVDLYRALGGGWQ